MKKGLFGLWAFLLQIGSSGFAYRWQYLRNEEFTKTPWTIHPLNTDRAYTLGLLANILLVE